MSVVLARRAIRIRGTVQGVGFRPYVYGLARRFALSGFVRNDLGGVFIEVEGDQAALDAFASSLVREPPPLARIAEVSSEPTTPRSERGFRIETSRGEGDGATIIIAPDVATCAECLREVLDPRERRAGYPFTNCTNCGPRLTIVQGAPYDRAKTTMGAFPLCEACRSEYEDPLDRRFHAQPVACAECGPHLSVLGPRGEPLPDEAPLATASEALRHGAIVAIKGLGGYHLACDAASEEAVAKLRARKHRDEKPFAVIVADADSAGALAVLGAEQRALLTSPARPIVLLRRRDGAPLAEGVAPGSDLVGLMLPYTPLHHLLLREVGRPLVLTSGNRASEPIAFEDQDAVARLTGVADSFLVHDRPIAVRCDDSVVRFDRGAAIPFRRSRGYAPSPVKLPLPLARPTLAVGGHLKATFALGAGAFAFASHHLGDLDHYEAQRAYAAAIAHYEALFRIRPERIVHDLHPDYASSAYARDAAGVLERVAVQHHHAHMASCMAENALVGDAIGVVWDGAGLGTDGTIWGGEFLVGGYASVERAAHWANVPMPGGESATREPWRMALAHLLAAGLDAGPLRERIPERSLEVVARMCAHRINSPLTSSVGRLFDAVAALVGVRDRVSFEGQAAIRLETLAASEPRDGAYPFVIGETEPLVLDSQPLIRSVVEDVRRGVSAPRIARRFHSTLVAALVAVCERLRAARGTATVVLSGGVFMNAILASEASAALEERGFRVARHRDSPPNDGGLSLGQLAIAAGRDAAARERS